MEFKLTIEEAKKDIKRNADIMHAIVSEKYNRIKNKYALLTTIVNIYIWVTIIKLIVDLIKRNTTNLIIDDIKLIGIGCVVGIVICICKSISIYKLKKYIESQYRFIIYDTGKYIDMRNMDTEEKYKLIEEELLPLIYIDLDDLDSSYN